MRGPPRGDPVPVKMAGSYGLLLLGIVLASVRSRLLQTTMSGGLGGLGPRGLGPRTRRAKRAEISFGPMLLKIQRKYK